MVEAKFTPLEVLAARGNTSRFSTVRSLGGDGGGLEIEHGQKFADALMEKAKRTVEEGGRNIFREVLLSKRESPYFEKNIFEMRSKFGAGQVTEDKRGNLKGPEEAVEMAKEGINQIDKISNFLEYCAIINKLDKPGYMIPDDQKGKWNAMRETAFVDILRIDGFMKLFPVMKMLDPVERQEFIEETLTRDPALQIKITGKMDVLQEESRKLLEVKPWGRGKKESLELRLWQERKLVDDLGNVIPEAITGVLEERYDAMIQVQEKGRQKEVVMKKVKKNFKYFFSDGWGYIVKDILINKCGLTEYEAGEKLRDYKFSVVAYQGLIDQMVSRKLPINKIERSEVTQLSNSEWAIDIVKGSIEENEDNKRLVAGLKKEKVFEWFAKKDGKDVLSYDAFLDRWYEEYHKFSSLYSASRKGQK